MALMGCPLHGYQCGRNCMAASQQMGMAQYHDYIESQMRALQQRGMANMIKESEKKKSNKKLLLLPR